MTKPQITLTTPTDVITAVAWILGFHPTNSLIVLAFSGPAPTLRIDFPQTGEELIEAAATIGAAYRRNPGGEAIVLAHTDDPIAGFDAITAISAMVDGLIDVKQGLIVAGGRWLSTSGGAGSIDPERVALVEAEMVATGRTRPKPSRAGLASDLTPIDPAPVEAHRADVPTDRLTPQWVTARIEEFHRDGLTLTDNDAAAVLLALTDNTVFDAVMTQHATTNAHTRTALWHDLARRGPEDLRGNAAALLALSAWLTGQGALAWVAIEHSNKRGLAQIVGDLLENAVSPATWDTIRGGLTD